MGETYKDIINSMSDLMKVCKHRGLSVNQEKTKKYMYYEAVTREVRSVKDKLDLEVNGMFFQQVHNFKNLGPQGQHK